MTADIDLRAGFRRDQIRRGLASRTIQERNKVLDYFTRTFEDVPLAERTREHIDEWLDHCKITARTRTGYLSALHMFYAWALDEGHVTVDPTVRIRRPILRRMVPRPISTDDLDHAIRSAPPRMRAWLCLAANEGFRCKEIALLRREDVLDRHDPPLLRVWKGKGDHQAILPLNPETLAALRCFGLPTRGYVFTRPTDALPLKPGSVSKLGSVYLHGLGIDATMHQLRHWFGTAIWALTKDVRVTQEMLRHSHPGTMAGYVAFDPQLAQQAVAKIHELRRSET